MYALFLEGTFYYFILEILGRIRKNKESELKLADVGKTHLILETHTFWYNHEVDIAM